MKNKITYIFLAIAILLSSWSCNDFLDETSSAQITAESQFSSESGFKDALIGVYIGMTTPELYSRDLMYNLVDLLSRQYELVNALSDYAQVQNYNYRGVESTPQVDALWTKTYNIIANINSALDVIDEQRNILDPIDYAVIKGEFLGLRAFLHFDLMRLYGLGNLAERNNGNGELAIPYVISFTKNVTPRRSYTETFNLMETDIENALELLKEDPIYTESSKPNGYYDQVNRNGFYNNRELRINYYTVKALKARVLIWQGGLQNLDAARVAAEEVITQSPAMLISASDYPVASDPILYPEIIFALDVNALVNVYNGFLDAADSNASINLGALFLSQSRADELYEANNPNIGVADIRFNTLLEPQNQGLVSTKLIQDSGISNKDKVPLMKLPEMYYIVAEYYLNANNLQLAIANLNTVRQSRGIIEDIPDTATAEEVREELIKEYQKEYIGEGQLFFFYKRLGFTTFPGLGDEEIANDEIYVLPYPDTEL